MTGFYNNLMNSHLQQRLTSYNFQGTLESLMVCSGSYLSCWNSELNGEEYNILIDKTNKINREQIPAPSTIITHIL